MEKINSYPINILEGNLYQGLSIRNRGDVILCSMAGTGIRSGLGMFPCRGFSFPATVSFFCFSDPVAFQCFGFDSHVFPEKKKRFLLNG